MNIYNKRILIIAEHASLKFGGEAALPLHYFRVLRKRQIEVWLIVHERTKEELINLFPDEGDRIYFIKDTFVHLLLWRCGKFLPKKLAYFTFGSLLRLTTQITQRRIAKQVILEKKIDIIHQPIPVSPKEPSLIFNMGVPIVIGPMNGGMTYPDGFKYMENFLVRKTVEIGRTLSNFLNFLIPGKRKATTLLVANQRTKEALPQKIEGKIIELVENGVDLSIWQKNSNSKFINNNELTFYSQDDQTKQAIKFVFVGRLVDWKAVDLLINAFKQVLEKLPVELEIIGDGVERENLELQVQELGLASSNREKLDSQKLMLNEHYIQQPIHFLGWLSQTECAERLQLADILVLPSLHECGGAVILEAMSMELPVIATNWGGPADYVDESCGILVEPKSRDLFIDYLANAMLKLARSLELRKTMGQAGRQSILENFDWEKKIDKILEIYQEAIDRYIPVK
ncbi:group 1 glycosyl transferase [Chondrocystis sp. NIES-4102]|nr:group 1 glycosyl transferase [Chondrocystis sp. NIES-4102]